MRRLDEGPATAPSHTGAGAFIGMPLRQTAPFFAFALALLPVRPLVGLDSRDVDPRIAEVWPPGGVGFVLLTTVWFAGRRVLGATLALMFARLRGHRGGDGLRAATSPLWLALTGVAQPAADDLALPAALEHTDWAPETPQDVAALLFAAVGSSLAARARGRLPVPLTRRPSLEGAAVVGAAQHGVLLRRRRDLHGDVLRPAVHRPAAQLVAQPDRTARHCRCCASTAPTSTPPCPCRGC